MPYLVVESIPGHASSEAEPVPFRTREEATRHALDLVQEYRERGYRVKHSRLQWFCELSRRDPVTKVEVLEVPYGRPL